MVWRCLNAGFFLTLGITCCPMTLTADGSWMMERGLLDGKFHFKKLRDGSVEKTKAVCTDCQAEFSYHLSTSSLNYHMQAKHTASSSSVSNVSGSSSSVHSGNIWQTTLTKEASCWLGSTKWKLYCSILRSICGCLSIWSMFEWDLNIMEQDIVVGYETTCLKCILYYRTSQILWMMFIIGLVCHNLSCFPSEFFIWTLSSS